jgi:anti-sigma factor RsiW
MACPEFEDLILDYCEGAAPPADRTLLESHVAACTDCRAFLYAQQELDLRLARSLPRPALSAVFASRMAARIARHRHIRRFQRLPRVLDCIGYLSLAFAAGCLLEQLPHAGIWIGLATLAGSAAFGLWESGKALRQTFSHR